MVRTEIKQGDITIAYGHDHMMGYFLAVVNKRLAYKSNLSNTVLKVIEKVNSDQGGSYFDLHTGAFGFGHKVDKETLIYFWKAYGIPDEDSKKVIENQT